MINIYKTLGIFNIYIGSYGRFRRFGVGIDRMNSVRFPWSNRNSYTISIDLWWIKLSVGIN